MQKLTELELKKNAIAVWYCSFHAHKACLAKYVRLLATDEQQKANRFKFRKDKECYIITRGILRLLLATYLKQRPEEIIFEYTSYGKPFLANENSLKFNVSHSGNMAAFVFFYGTEIGVDIEKVKANFNVLELAQNFFSKKEITALEQQPEKELPKAFFRCWTRKEAFIKAEGSGLSFPLDKFAVSLDDDIQAELLETQWNESEKKEWSLYSFVPANDYIAAVAIAKPNVEIDYKNFDTL